MTNKQISLFIAALTAVGAIIAYLNLREENNRSISTSGSGSPVIIGSENVEVNK